MRIIRLLSTNCKKLSRLTLMYSSKRSSLIVLSVGVETRPLHSTYRTCDPDLIEDVDFCNFTNIYKKTFSALDI